LQELAALKQAEEEAMAAALYVCSVSKQADLYGLEVTGVCLFVCVHVYVVQGPEATCSSQAPASSQQA